jgi:hypothetical protein
MFTDLTKLKVYEVTLNPSEILFIPIGWWHQVESLDRSITLSYTNFVFKNDFSSTYTSVGEL